MRPVGSLHPTESIPYPADSVQTMLIASSSGQAMDWPAGSGNLVRFTGMTTGGATMNFMVNLGSTYAAVPSSGSSVTTGTTAGSTWNNVPVIGQQTWQLPSFSTGWSCAALTSGYVIAEIWRK